MRALAICALLFACACAKDDDAVPVDDRPDAQTLPGSDAGSSDACGDACAPVDCTTVDFCAAPFPVSRLASINAIWGSGRDDVWAVGTRGTILHGDGTAFAPVAAESPDIYVAVWGTSKSDVWILGPSFPSRSTGFAAGKAEFVPERGATWDPAQSTSGRIWTGHSAGSRVWLAGEPSRRFGASSSFWTFDGAAWSPSPSCEGCAVRGLFAIDANTAWAVGRGGRAFVFDAAIASDGGAQRWIAEDSATRDDLDAVWASGPSDVWAVGRNGTIRHTSRGAPEWSAVASGTTSDLHAVWGSGPSDVWAAGDDGTVLHYDGSKWSPATAGFGGDRPTHLLSIWGSGPDDVWIGGEGVLLHRSATSRRHP